MSEATWRYRVRPLRALRELRGIERDSEDLVGPARFFLLVGGHDDGRTHRRILRDAQAREVLEERRPLPEALQRQDALLAMPAGSLGRSYAEHLQREGLDPRRITEATRDAYRQIASEVEGEFASSELHEFVRSRTRDVHDLLHALTGYGTDYLGEGGVVSFTFANFGNRGYLGLAVVNAFGLLLMGQLRALRFMWDGYRRGRRARFLWGADWQSLLERPLDEVRRDLGIEPVGSYEPIESFDLLRVPADA
jgi:ubiquinone biosynthesis protein COQ4